jgi:hypothetical protein
MSQLELDGSGMLSLFIPCQAAWIDSALAPHSSFGFVADVDFM